MQSPSSGDQNGVHIGKNGWLFLTGGSNEVMRLLSDPTLFTSRDARGWAERLLVRQERLNVLGAQYFHIWAPDKLAIYRHEVEFDPSILVIDPCKMVYDEAIIVGADDVLIDLLPELQVNRNRNLLYWKTDSHWTYWGACSALQSICKGLGVEAVAGLMERPVVFTDLILDLGAKLTTPPKESWGGAQVLRDAKIVYRNEMVNLLNILHPRLGAPMLRGTSVAFANTGSTCDKRRLLIFGDSFSEYRPHLLTGLLAETFRNVLFVWSSSIDYDLVADFRPDIVITETAERFIKTIPDDSLNLNSFVSGRITNFLNTNCGNGLPFVCDVARHPSLVSPTRTLSE